MIQIFTAGEALGRKLIVVDAPLAEVPQVTTKEFGGNFLCAFVLDDAEWQDLRLEKAVRYVLDQGANSLFFHGKDCGRALSLADYIIAQRTPTETKQNVVLTAAYPALSLGAFLETTTVYMMPATEYLDNWTSDVFLCIAGHDQARLVVELLR